MERCGAKQHHAEMGHLSPWVAAQFDFRKRTDLGARSQATPQPAVHSAPRKGSELSVAVMVSVASLEASPHASMAQCLAVCSLVRK